MTIVENLQRADLNPMEQARAYQRLSQDFKMTQEQMATRTGKERASVANFLRLLTLTGTNPAQSRVRRPLLRPRPHPSGLRLTRINHFRRPKGPGPQPLRPPDRKLRPRPDQPRSQTQKRSKAHPARRSQRPRSPGRLQRTLGLKVHIEDKKGKGRVIIEYSGLEDFDAILTALGGQ